MTVTNTKLTVTKAYFFHDMIIFLQMLVLAATSQKLEGYNVGMLTSQPGLYDYILSLKKQFCPPPVAVPRSQTQILYSSSWTALA